MTDTESLAASRVISPPEAAEFLSLSPTQLKALNSRGEGPPRVRLSARRVGYTLGDLAKWIAARREKRS